VSAEVRTPFMESPRDPIIEDDEETKNKLIQSKKQFEIKQQIDNRNKEIFKLQKNNFYGMTANLPTAKVSRRNKEEKEEGEN
jgi:hypothetical protein